MKLKALLEFLGKFDGVADVSPVRHCIYITEGSTILAILDIEKGLLTEVTKAKDKRKPDNTFGVQPANF